jgi:hypothetical protein
LIMQPQDVLPSGQQDMCDGCPNKTILDGRLVPMCRVEEYITFGDMVTLKKKKSPGRRPPEALPVREEQPEISSEAMNDACF